MTSQSFKAMISLLDDSDPEVVDLLVEKIMMLGDEAIPLLKEELVLYDENPLIQSKIETIMIDLQLNVLINDFKGWVGSENQDLLTGLWLISRLADYEVDLKEMKEEVNRIFSEIWVMTKDDIHPLDLLNIFNDVIFNKMGFEPNVKNFHSPDNSLFNLVLEKKKGNPVTLSCLYILLAKGLNIPLFGINLPNLFVTVYDLPDYRLFVNPFNKGQVFRKKDLLEYLKQMNLEPQEKYFSPCTNQDIIVRVLTNLAFAYQKSGNKSLEAQVNRILDIFHN